MASNGKRKASGDLRADLKSRAVEGPQRSTRSKVTISTEEHQKNLDLGNAQPTINMSGGVGIPGGRTRDDVLAFKPLDFSKLKVELGAILDTSAKVREMRDDENGIEAIRRKVLKVNRRVDYASGNKTTGVHSLHVGNDIAAVSNSRASKVYDYPDLAAALDKRLNVNKRNSKTYWKSSETLDARRGHIATGLQHLIAGDQEKAEKSFGKDGVGLTARGRKWVYKMGTLLLAERGRELHGSGGSQVHKALSHVKGTKSAGSRSFEDVFVKRAATLALFAERGGAKTLK